MKINTKNLQTAGNFAKENNVTTASVYRWLKMKLIRGIEVDGVKFVIKPIQPKN